MPIRASGAEVLAQHCRRRIVVEGYSPFMITDLRHPVLAETAASHGVTEAQVVSAGTSSTGWW